MQIEANFGAWQAWYNLPEPEEGAIPNDYEKRLSDNLFERMLLIRCIAPDRFYFAAQDYIEQHPALGVAYTKPPVGDFLASYEQSKPSTPIICLLSLGTRFLLFPFFFALLRNCAVAVPPQLRRFGLADP